MAVLIQEIKMADKFRKQVIICPDRRREVEVTYTVSGNWFAPRYDVVACPAMYDGEQGCGRICKNMLASSVSYPRFARNPV
jgi:hypothetical protein